MKPSKRFEWLFLYCLIWMAAVQLSLWAWGGVVDDALVRLGAGTAMLGGDLLILAWLWLRYEADGHRRGQPRLGPGGMPLPPPPGATPKPAAAAAAPGGAKPAS